jgi:hypothetical protein
MPACDGRRARSNRSGPAGLERAVPLLLLIAHPAPRHYGESQIPQTTAGLSL